MGFPRGLLLSFLGAAAALLLGSCLGSSSYSLRAFYTLVSEPMQDTPQFIGVAYLDDQLLGHYDSNKRRCLPDAPWAKKLETSRFLQWCSDRAQESEVVFRRDLRTLQEHFNQTTGLHTWQRMHGCELSEDGRKRGYFQYAYDGRDFISLDTETLIWTAANATAHEIKKKWDAESFITEHRKRFMEDICFDVLTKLLEYGGKEALLRRETPKVKVKRKTSSQGLEILICQAHGFYPKEIDATWRKDGEVWEQETFRGGVIPNSDGTYHTWLSIDIDPKDRDQYRCHVEHDSLPEPLHLAWEEPASGLVWTSVGVISAVLVAVLLMAGIAFYLKRQQEDTAYTAALTSNQGSDSPAEGSRGIPLKTFHELRSRGNPGPST
ncbi:class I histocompatibility antigen, F10 alpha chain-like [Hemicordylus capensis]|uniref:class I histocompatibility antigen, F10 alpha chain-like n=1 Tax=Hemicordylus capensis TaxID=884348 RepID=UPI0023025502|nr:class I histocompatibility antigen, F10 alpha chain-like [Hemicordylus capensis]